MRKLVVASVGIVVLAVPLAVGSPASGAPSRAPAGRPATGTRFVPPVGPHEMPNPLEDKRRELREKAISDVLAGRATPEKRGSSTVVRVADASNTPGAGAGGDGSRRGGHHSGNHRGQYVELEREATDRVFVVLTEFGNERHPDYPDQDTDPTTPGPLRFDGPAHNEIPEPDRTVDNTTIWEPNYSQDYFENLYFGPKGRGGMDSVRTYFEKQSSGRYSIDGTVTDWVRVRYNEARYGRSGGYPCDDVVCDNVWNLISDSVNQWVADQRYAGRTDAEIKEELATFDVYDRYDYDLDGDFDEPDGYIDHFQILHAGGDEADGDPYQAEDAIWSHRWYAYVSDVGITGPPDAPLGGAQIGDTGIWVGDYTVQPENGGLSTIAHEYAHDLGIPDLYDTSGGGDNSQEYWSLMAQSRLGGRGEAIGTRAGDLGAWVKLQLGWLDYEIVRAGEKRLINQGPSEFNTRKAQATVVVLPDKTVTFDYGPPYAGQRMYWSGSGDNLRNSMTKSFDATGFTTFSLDLQARFEIEAGYDYLYVQTSTDGGATWQFRDGTVGGTPFVRDGSDNPAISGSSGGDWLDVHVPLDDVAGGPVDVRFLYATDGAVAPDGFFADEISTTGDGTTQCCDGGEAEEGWTLEGFATTTGTETGDFPHFYIGATRSYTAQDRWLATGPYNFGFVDQKPDWVEHYRYQTGLLLSYWDTSQADNNTNEHPGEGLILNIDSRPRPFARLDGELWRTRIQIYDAPFTWRKADSMTLHVDSQPSYIRGQRGVPYFDDAKKYWYAENPNQGVSVPEYGVVIIVGRLRHDGGMLVWYGSKNRDSRA